ncbi:hypothetical protein GCM10025795_23280 [Verticiella sediminum]
MGVLEGLALLAERLGTHLTALLADTQRLIHGTTVATNCLAERSGAHVGLITTRGFRDVLEMREGTKEKRYDLRSPFPQPLIVRPDRREVAERILWDGKVDSRLDEDGALEQIRWLRRRGVQAVVVGFLHSHVNPVHEQRVRELIEAEGWDVYTVLSHEILRGEGEYDRFSTAAVNAYVGPRLSAYLRRLERRLREAGATFPLMIMQSTGGLLPVGESARYAVGCITSGPAGGAIASALFARLGELAQVVAYDTGGTTTDISVIEAGSPAERRQTALRDVKIAVPSIDIQVVPLGGGSIARLDAGGILTLGPDSAGAAPGPACYGRGGTRATLTDANLTLGYLAADTFLGGRMALRPDLAERAIREAVAEPLGLSVERASLAIHALASSRIAQAVRAATLRRGMDPRELALLSFGGAGGVHTVQVARELAVAQAVVPREASVFSALGFLSADVRLDGQRAFGRLLTQTRAGDLETVFTELETQLRRRMRDCGFDDDSIRIARYLDCRYRRQISTIEVAVPDDLPAADIRGWLVAPFEARYRQYYGHVHENEPPFIELCRMCAFGRVTRGDGVRPSDAGAAAQPRPAAFASRRRIYVDGWIDVPTFWFDELRAGDTVSGPALVESPTTTVVLPAGSRGRIDPFGSLCIQEETAP